MLLQLFCVISVGYDCCWLRYPRFASYSGLHALLLWWIHFHCWVLSMDLQIPFTAILDTNYHLRHDTCMHMYYVAVQGMYQNSLITGFWGLAPHLCAMSVVRAPDIDAADTNFQRLRHDAIEPGFELSPPGLPVNVYSEWSTNPGQANLTYIYTIPLQLKKYNASWRVYSFVKGRFPRLSVKSYQWGCVLYWICLMTKR